MSQHSNPNIETISSSIEINQFFFLNYKALILFATLFLKEPDNATSSNETTKNKYSLRDPVDLRSKFLLDVEKHKLKKANDQDHQELERQLEELRILEELPADENLGHRRHAWIVILSNVEWAAKKSAGSDHTFDAITPVQPFFIEPSTGVHFSIDDTNYFTIDSIWNESNYYVCYHMNITGTFVTFQSILCSIFH